MKFVSLRSEILNIQEKTSDLNSTAEVCSYSNKYLQETYWTNFQNPGISCLRIHMKTVNFMI